MDSARVDAATLDIRIIVASLNLDRHMLCEEGCLKFLITLADNYLLFQHTFSLHYPQHKIVRTALNVIWMRENCTDTIELSWKRPPLVTHLHSGSSLHESATVWHARGGLYTIPLDDCGLIFSGGRCAHIGWSFSWASKHESCRFGVFL